MSSTVRKLAERSLAAVRDVPARRRRRQWIRTVSGSLRPSNVCVLCVYRHTNAERVRSLVDGQATEIRLWALDAIAPDLSEWTLGTGPGPRMDLLNRLLPEHPAAFDALVIVDDDVVFIDGSLTILLDVAQRLDLHIVQPAHVPWSFYTRGFNVSRPGLLARQTGFVEIGPIVLFRADGLSRVLPFPEDSGMGWGLEVDWYLAQRDGIRLGVVDAVTIRHLHRAGTTYGRGAEQVRVHSKLRDAGINGLSSLMTEYSRWSLPSPTGS